jgi:hypothetical protein
VVVAVVDGFQIFSQVVSVEHQELVILDEDNHPHQVFEMILLIMEILAQVNGRF